MKFGIALLSSIATTVVAQSVTGESKFADLDHLKVHYTTYGKGESALFFVHGWACDETVWSENAPELAKNIRVITIDLPGHGQSDKPNGVSYNKDLYARAIDAVVTNAEIKSMILVSHSNGTPFARHYYREYPSKVKAMVIVEGPLRSFFGEPVREAFIGQLQEPNYPDAMARMIDGMAKPMKNDALRAKLKAMMLKTPQHVAISEFEATDDADLWKQDPIEVPVLMILARQPAWSPEYEQFVRKLIPTLDYQMWEDVSHFLMMDKPSEFNAAIVKFLEQNKLASGNAAIPNRSARLP